MNGENQEADSEADVDANPLDQQPEEEVFSSVEKHARATKNTDTADLSEAETPAEDGGDDGSDDTASEEESDS